MAADEIYREIILDHYRHPDRESINSPSQVIHASNPLCGDELTVVLRTLNSRLEQVDCNAVGCAISVAAASILSQMSRKRSLPEVCLLATTLRDCMLSPADKNFPESLGDLVALEGVRKSPARVKCALLACEALLQISAQAPQDA